MQPNPAPHPANELADLVERLLRIVQEGDKPLPWVVHSSCSYLRIASAPTRENMRIFSDGNVLHGTKCWHSGHPDLSMDERQLNALVGIINNAPQIIAALRRTST